MRLNTNKIVSLIWCFTSTLAEEGNVFHMKECGDLGTAAYKAYILLTDSPRLVSWPCILVCESLILQNAQYSFSRHDSIAIIPISRKLQAFEPLGTDRTCRMAPQNCQNIIKSSKGVKLTELLNIKSFNRIMN